MNANITMDFGKTNVLILVISCNRCTIPVRDVNNGKKSFMVEGVGREEELYRNFLLKFYVNLKLLK